MPIPAGQDRGVVAVGYDGSDSARLAVRWAARYTADRHLCLRVVHAWVWPVFTRNLGPVRGVAGSGLRHSAEAVLAEGVELARSAAAAASEAAGRNTGTDGTAVEGFMAAGLPAPVLRNAARDVRLLVVGSRGMGAVLGSLAGSTCVDLARSAPCPVMVIRRPSIRDGPVAAGVAADADGPGTGARSAAVVAGAAQLAVDLHAPLRLVHVTSEGPGTGEGHGLGAPRQGQALVDNAVAEARKYEPGLQIDGILAHGQAAKELLAAAADADVLVLGVHSPGHGRGNTVSAVLHKAGCNVLIAR